MKFAYVVSEENRCVTQIDFTDKTSCDLLEYEGGDFEPGTIYTWDKNNVSDGFEYTTIGEIITWVGEGDTIFASEMNFKEIYEILNDQKYEGWNSSFDVCSKMLEEYSKIAEVISLEELIKKMQ